MLDLTKPLAKPIRKAFLENVLDGIDRSKVIEDDMGDMPLDHLNKLLEELDTNVGTITPVDRLEQVVRDRGESPTAPSKWWIEKDSKGMPIEPKFNTGDPITKVLVAPYYLVKYVIKSVQRNIESPRNDLIPFLKSLFLSFGALAIFAILLIANDLKFIVSAKELAIISTVISLGSKVASHVMGEDEFDEEISDIEETYLPKEDIEVHDDTEYFEPEEYESDEFDYFDDIDYDTETDSTMANHSMLKKEYSKNLKLDENIIRPTITDDEFNNKLVDVLLNNEHNRRKVPKNREELVMSFSDYILCNNPGFSETKTIPKGSIVYNNINYLIYEGLRGIFTQLTYTGEHIMTVSSVVENQLYYKVEVALPKIVKLAGVVRDLNILESKFKEHEADNEVDINVTAYSDIFVFRVKKPSNSIVTWGDIIRYYDPVTDKKTYEEFMSPKYRFPVIAGLQNDETPIIFDIAKNTSMAIAGTSGSGKSWVVYSLLFNILIQCHPGDANFVILDFKGDPQYMELARMPHVVGYHGEIERYNDYLKEIVLELNRRKQITKKIGISKWDDIRDKFKDDPEKLHKFPWLFVVIEETAAVLSSLETASKKTELKDEFIRNLKEVAKQGRSLGMRIIMISQRTTDKELPRDIEAECGVKFTLKLKDADLDRVDMLPSGVVAPRRKGVAVFKEENLTEPIIIKTMGIGGLNDEQVKNLTRMLAFEWNLRVSDEELARQYPTFKLTDNRSVRREQVFEDLKNERYFIDVDNIDLDAVLGQIDGTLPEKKPVKQPVKQPVESSWEEFFVEPVKDEEDEEIEYLYPYTEDEDYEEDYKEDYKEDSTGLIDIDDLVNPNQEELVDIDQIVQKPVITEPDTQPVRRTPRQMTGMMGPGMQRRTTNTTQKEPVETQPAEKPQQVTKPVVPDKPVERPVTKRRSPNTEMKKKKSIVEFILTYGEKDSITGASKMKHETLTKYYSRVEISEALGNIEIVDQEGYFIT